MSKKFKLIIGLVLLILAVLICLFFLHRDSIAILNPQGPIAQQQKNLIVFTLLLSSVIVLPVFTMTFLFAWKYRAGNKKAKYRPDWDHHNVYEIIWWSVPTAIIAVLAVVAWNTSHSLDPFKPLDSTTKPLTIQVVAMDWKWLFIYPEQNIATVNYVQFPKDTPINFEITSDGPMNSFWIPKLGGQVYAMAGMKTKLHLQASEVGDFEGSSANLSGKGFAGMRFTAKATSQANFDEWLESVAEQSNILTSSTYATLAVPSENVKPLYYAATEEDLYESVIMKYMAHGHGEMHEHDEHEVVQNVR